MDDNIIAPLGIIAVALLLTCLVLSMCSSKASSSPPSICRRLRSIPQGAKVIEKLRVYIAVRKSAIAILSNADIEIGDIGTIQLVGEQNVRVQVLLLCLLEAERNGVSADIHQRTAEMFIAAAKKYRKMIEPVIRKYGNSRQVLRDARS